MSRCLICGEPIPKDRAKYPTCSTDCGEVLTAQRRKVYATKERNARWQESRMLKCVVCGATLKHPGFHCKEHKTKRMRKGGKTVVQSQE